MIRVLSGAVLIAFAVWAVWLAPAWLFFLIAELVLLLAFIEYSRMAAACGLPIPAAAAGAAAMLSAVGVSGPGWLDGRAAPGPVALDGVLMSAFVVLAAMTLGAHSTPARERRGAQGPPQTTEPGCGAEPHVRGDGLGRAAAALFPSLYLGLPIGAMIAIRGARGPSALFLLMLTVIVSDTAQYYTGRLTGRRLLAPAISPKKTIEGAIGGFVFGSATLTAAGAWWLPGTSVGLRALVGVAVVALGIAGDLFESMLKRSADLKDSSALIPGHGGMLDRIDALLFAAPIYYVVLKYV